MTNHFYLVALPRSRTAWLSNLFTAGPAVCLHDAVRMSENVPHLDDVFLRVGAQYVGTADNSLAAFPEAEDVIGDAPVVVVRRDPRDVRRSLSRKYPQLSDRYICETVTRADSGLDRLSKLPQAITVSYTDLDKVPCLRRMWGHLLPAIPFDSGRAGRLRGLHIEMREPWYTDGITSSMIEAVSAALQEVS